MTLLQPRHPAALAADLAGSYRPILSLFMPHCQGRVLLGVSPLGQNKDSLVSRLTGLW